MRKPFLAVVIGCGILLGARGWNQEVRSLADEKEPKPSAAKKETPKRPKEAKKDAPDTKEVLGTPALAKFMRAKLGAAQLVLEGLALEDFEKIEAGAATLTKLSAAEQWRVSGDSMYAQHSDNFVRIANKLQVQADEHNLDGVALNYMQLTMSCVECHRFVRTVLLAGDLGLPGATAKQLVVKAAGSPLPLD